MQRLLLCQKLCLRSLDLTAITGSLAPRTRKSVPAGLTLPMIMKNGLSWYSSGCGIVWSAMGRRKWKAGNGNYGMSLILGIGRALRNIILSCMTIRLMPLNAPCPLLKWTDRKLKDRDGTSGRISHDFPGSYCKWKELLIFFLVKVNIFAFSLHNFQ